MIVFLTDMWNWAKLLSVNFSTMISFIALSVSILIYIFNRRSWYETYRPIVVAEIKSTELAGQHFKIILYNVGNRPACDVYIEYYCEYNKKDPQENRIQLLRNGEEKALEFELSISISESLRCDLFNLSITYTDHLLRKKMKSAQKLHVKYD